MRKGPPSIPVAERFWTKVRKTGGCWLWTASRDRWGYGMILGPKRRPRLAHRVAWELTFGAVPIGLLVLHHCDIPHCVNPSHLWLGTQRDNLADAKAKGRRPSHLWAHPHRKETAS